MAGVSTRILLRANKAVSRYEAGYVFKLALAHLTDITALLSKRRSEKPQQGNEQLRTSAVREVRAW